MTSKENILSQIRNSRRTSYEMPSLDEISTIQYEDRMKQFISVTQMVGGRTIVLEQGQNVNELIRCAYPAANTIASSLPYIEATFDPDKVNHASDLNGVDVGVVEGEVAVAENGCIWIPQTMKERAVLFISECLVIIVDRNAIVNNMHEAYDKIRNISYGCFISGPSKTADIAQALVMGAQAARDVTVIIA